MNLADQTGATAAVNILQTWDGRPAGTTTRLTLTVGDAALQIEIDAPWHGDPPPDSPPGSTPGLWEHEVVELMVLGDDDKYLELEFGPHGHYLELHLHGRRNVTSRGGPVRFQTRRRGDRWEGSAWVPLDRIPGGETTINAFAIHGVGPAREYLAWKPAGGAQPDFHRLDVFARPPWVRPCE